MSAEACAWVMDTHLPRRDLSSESKLLLLLIADSYSPYAPNTFSVQRLADMLGWPTDKVMDRLDALMSRRALTWETTERPGRVRIFMELTHVQ